MSEKPQPVVEQAQPVVEDAVAPNTPPQDAPKKAIGYNAQALPNPINPHEQYVQASWVEARLLRQAVEKLVTLLQEFIDAQSKAASNKK